MYLLAPPGLKNNLARTHISLLQASPLFDIQRLHRLIVQAEGLRPLRDTWVMFNLKNIAITLERPGHIQLQILCEERDWQLSSLTQLCNQHLPLSSVEQLSAQRL